MRWTDRSDMPATARPVQWVIEPGGSEQVSASTRAVTGCQVEPCLAVVSCRGSAITSKVTANRMETLFPWAWKAEWEGMADQGRRAA